MKRLLCLLLAALTVTLTACGGGGSIPYTVVLDRNGIIRKKFVGAITYDKLVAAIEECR
ncbi:MAG: hypothetical protein IJN04_06355 [Clostridia bacterium]|nr:hypothetical protein [Clostridia bacterium]